MTRDTFFSLVAAIALSAAPAFPASSTIGVATAVASFSVDNSTMTGDANVFDGTELRTTTSPGDVRLRNGTDVRLATRSAGTIYNDYVVLREGAIRVTSFDSYTVKASQLEIEADNPAAQAVIRMAGKKIEIAALGGSVRVTDGGAMLTRVAAGTKAFFQNTGSNPGQTGATPGQPPAQTGAAPAPEAGPVSDRKVILWTAGICAVGAAIVGGIAASQGKNPF
jgi:ferric-dicitrate binding protein FerR (iron transport regulator)